jgi:hypothetical protein
VFRFKKVAKADENLKSSTTQKIIFFRNFSKKSLVALLKKCFYPRASPPPKKKKYLGMRTKKLLPWHEKISHKQYFVQFVVSNFLYLKKYLLLRSYLKIARKKYHYYN